MKYTNLLTANNNDVLNDLIERCSTITNINIHSIKSLSIESAKSTNSGSPLPTQLNNLLNKWYDSLVNHTPDYSVYGEDEYIAELWACWKVYSKTHLRNIQKTESLINHSISSRHQDNKVIVDLGCGFAYTTAAITQIFPVSKVYGTNLDGTLQMKVAIEMANDYGFTMANDPSNIKEPVDLVFASEYFEHFQSPLDHLDYVIDTIKPQAFLIANAFGPLAIGHFKEYNVDGQFIDAKSTGKLFNKRMKHHGYVKVKTGLWNSRPAYWVKNDL